MRMHEMLPFALNIFGDHPPIKTQNNLIQTSGAIAIFGLYFVSS